MSEHAQDIRRGNPKNAFVKHLTMFHPNEERDPEIFKIEVLRTFRKNVDRQIAEAGYIYRSIMYQSNRSFNILSLGNARAFELLKIGLFKFPPSGQKSHSNDPPISSEIPLLKDKFRLQSNTVHTFQREICRDDTFKLLSKTLLKELFTNKGEILSCKSVKPCKNRRN